MKKLLFLLLLIPALGSAQVFQRTYGNSGAQTGTCIQHTLDGNYIVSAIGGGGGAGANDFFLMKLTTAGTILWTKSYGGTANDSPYYVSTCADGGYILSGSTTSFGNGSDVYLVRTDSDGGLLWSKTIGGSGTDIGWFTTENSDGSFYTCGQTNSFAGPSYNGYLIKNDSGGNLVWTKVFGGTSSDNFYGMSKTSDGGLIITGQVGTNSFGSSDIWLVRTDANGDTLWTNNYGKVTEDAGWAVIQTTDGGFAVTGDMHKDTVTPGAHRSLLLKTNSAGTMQWANVYGSTPGSEVGYDIVQTSDGGYTIMGNTNAYGQGSKDILLMHTNNSGILQWANTFGSTVQDDCWQFRKTADGGYVVIAATENFAAANVWDIYLVKTDALGKDSCYESVVLPESYTPFLQQRSGFPVSTGGNAGNPATLVNTITLSASNPCSFTTAMEAEITSAAQVTVSPNPFTESARVQLTTNAAYRFRIFDLMGKQVFSASFSGNELLLKRGSLDAGIYFYEIAGGAEFFYSGKIIVQ